MRHLFVLVTMALITASSVFADPALGGGRGLFRVQDARVEEDGALVFANRVMFIKSDLGEDMTLYRGPLYGLEMNYAPFPMFEMFGSLVGVVDFRTNPNSFNYDWQGEALGAKLSIPWIPVLKLAASSHWLIEKRDHTFEGFLDGLGGSKGRSWRGIGALRLWELYKTLPTIMVNYGENVDTKLMYHHFFGSGVEFSSGALDLFIELTSEAGTTKDLFSKDAKTRVTPGVRIKIPYFHLNGGVELGVTDSVPDYQAILGFSIVSPFPKPPRKPFGRLAGKVQDARSGLPLAAKVTLSGARSGSVKTDSKTGVFYMQKAPTGVIIAEASRDGYIPEAMPLVITDGGFATYIFNLKPLVPYGTVAGRVTDVYSGKPLEAQVSFVAIGIAPAKSNNVTGFFRVDNVPAGLVTVKIEKDGYFPEERIAEVEDGGVSKLNVALASLDMKGTLKGKVTDRKTGELVKATISFADAQRPAIQADAGTFSTELPVGSYDLKIDAPGYVQQTSNVKIDKGETVERMFEMVAKGMVLTLKGVYFEFAMASLKTESYPALMEAAQIMKDNPDIQVELQGHTDSLGSDAFNQKLSEKRAYAVMNWLVQFGGIDAKRITAKGYGESKPITSNDTDEGRQLNRRTDFVILK
jgi:outer membrane protein OmpA-like peptidoglycan-associated protein